MSKIYQPVNFKAIPEIAADVAFHKSNREGPEGRSKSISEAFMDKDHVYTLQVKVTDVELAQAVLLRGFSPAEESLIPGFELQEIVLDPNANINQHLSMYLRKLADVLESQ